MNKYYVYILASKRNGTLYTGVTNDLKRRVHEHKNDIIKGFTKKYKVHDLVYFEEFNDINDAMQREKNIKRGKEHGTSGTLRKSTRIVMIYIMI